MTTTRRLYEATYRAARQGRKPAGYSHWNGHASTMKAAVESLKARGARFNGDPGYSEVQTKHFPVYERQPHFRGLAALQRVEEKVKS